MATQNPNTWEALYNNVLQQKDQPGKGEILKRLDQLHEVAQHGSEQDFQTNVSDLLQTYGEQLGLSADVNGQDILREANEWRDRNFPINDKLSSETNQISSQKTPDIFDSLAAQLNKKGPEVARGHIGDSASPAIRSLQEQQLMDEFNNAVESGDERKINEILDKRLEAPDLLKNQWEIANQHINVLVGNKQISKEKKLGKDGKPLESEEEILRRHLSEQHELQKEKMQKFLQSDQGKMHQQHVDALTAAARAAVVAGEKEKAQLAFRALLASRMAVTAQFTIFEELTDINQPLLLNFGRAFAATMQQQALERQQQAQQIAAEENQIATAQTNQKINAFNRMQQLANAKGPQNIKNRALNKGLDLAAKALGPEAYAAKKAADEILKYKKEIIIGCTVITVIAVLTLAVITVLIISIIVLLTHQTRSIGGGSFADCQNAPPTVEAIQSSMATLGFALSGDFSPSNNGYHKASIIYQTVCNLSHSQKYISLIGATPSSPVGIYIRTSSDCINDHEHNPGDGDVCHQGRNNYCVNVASGCNDDYINEYNLGHELGHIIENRNPPLFQAFLKTVWNINNRPPLYACWFHAPYPNSDPAECFADLQGEYLTYNVWRSIWWVGNDGGKILAGAIYDGYHLTKTFSEYPTTFANYYNFFKENVFGGVEYQYGVTQNVNSASGLGNVGSALSSTGALCDPSNFTSTFGNQANNASCICRHESNGFAQAVLNTCGGVRLPPNASPEFSVGLFQINMHAHPNFNTCLSVATVASIDRKINSCSFSSNDIISVGEQTKMLSCLDTTHALDPRIQATYAYQLYRQAGNRWTPWYNSAKACGIL